MEATLQLIEALIKMGRGILCIVCSGSRENRQIMGDLCQRCGGQLPLLPAGRTNPANWSLELVDKVWDQGSFNRFPQRRRWGAYRGQSKNYVWRRPRSADSGGRCAPPGAGAPTCPFFSAPQWEPMAAAPAPPAAAASTLPPGRAGACPVNFTGHQARAHTCLDLLASSRPRRWLRLSAQPEPQASSAATGCNSWRSCPLSTSSCKLTASGSRRFTGGPTAGMAAANCAAQGCRAAAATGAASGAVGYTGRQGGSKLYKLVGWCAGSWAATPLVCMHLHWREPAHLLPPLPL
jgi:hypothetical protein